jgi:hypothetical protein
MRRFATVIALAAFVIQPFLSASAQDTQGQIQEQLAKIKENQAANKKSLLNYTWTELDTITLKGEVKKQESYQAEVGPDGKTLKAPLNPQDAAPAADAGGARGGRLKQRIVEKKKEEFTDYAHQIAALAQQYAQIDADKLQEAFHSGNIKLGPGKSADEVSIYITNYLKPNDSMTLNLNKAAKAIQSVQIGSYLDDPTDVVKIAVAFDKLADGTNHVSSMQIDGVSKQLNVAIQNSNYRKRG